MEIKCTDSAKKVMDFYSWIKMPRSVEECFRGMKSIIGISTPDVWNPINELNHKIENTNFSLFDLNKELLKACSKHSIKSYLSNNLIYLLENCTVYAVTYADINITEVEVKNIFCGNSHRIKVLNPEYDDGIGTLGVYRLGSGAIFIYLDKIVQYENPELIFQQVLLHEFIHALLDISPRLNQNNDCIPLVVPIDLEESLNNALVLWIYDKCASCDDETFSHIKDFMSKQPKPYNEALQIFDKGDSTFENKLEIYQKEKLLSMLNALSNPSQISLHRPMMYGYSLKENSPIPKDSIWFGDWLQAELEKFQQMVLPNKKFQQVVLENLNEILNNTANSIDSIFGMHSEPKCSDILLGESYPFGSKLYCERETEDFHLTLTVTIENDTIRVIGGKTIVKPTYKVCLQIKSLDNELYIIYNPLKEKSYELILVLGKGGIDFVSFLKDKYELLKCSFLPNLRDNSNKILLVKRFPTKEELIDIINEASKNKPLSNSFIRVICSETANPKFNRLQLRTNPPTFIELQPGENILTVEEYPDLKYGFSQMSENDEDNPDETVSHCAIANCQDVLSIDLSNFDGWEMTSMDEMFHSMQKLSEINLKGLDTSNVKSMVDTFRLMGEQTKLSISLDTSNVEDISGMMNVSGSDIIELKDLDFSNIKEANCVFTDDTQLLILDGIKIGENKPTDLFQGIPHRIIIKNCCEDFVNWIKVEMVKCEGEKVLNRIEIR